MFPFLFWLWRWNPGSQESSACSTAQRQPWCKPLIYLFVSLFIRDEVSSSMLAGNLPQLLLPELCWGGRNGPMWFLNSWASCCTPLILVLEGQRQEDLSELKASLVYKESSVWRSEILTSVSTSSGLYLYNGPLHSSCDSYKKKCHRATLKIIFK